MAVPASRVSLARAALPGPAPATGICLPLSDSCHFNDPAAKVNFISGGREGMRGGWKKRINAFAQEAPEDQMAGKQFGGECYI